MAIYLISDLHLDESTPKLSRLFTVFLQNHIFDADALYILGDFFEVWMGDDVTSAFHEDIKNQLKALTHKIPVFFLHGNRDFLVDKQFANSTGVKLINEPFVVDIYGEKHLLLHGDSLCSKDYLHQWFRKVSRARLVKKLFLSLPIKTRKNIALTIREKSKRRGQSLDNAIMDVDFKLLPTLLQKYQASTMIYGHTHRPSILLQQQTLNAWFKFYVLSDWGECANYLVCYEDGRKELRYFK